MQKISSLIISIYIATLLYANVFFIKQLTIVESSGQLFWNHIAIFLILVALTFFLINKYISTPYSRGAMRPIRTVLLLLALIGFIVAILYHIIPLEPIYNLPDIIDKFFISDTAFTIWLLIPLAVLFI
ncbi:MAG: hypothetical protein ABIF06_00855 [bacterium]